MRTRQWLRAGILVFLGLYFLDNMRSGRIAFYINSTFNWLSWFGGIVFLLLGIFSVMTLLREQPEIHIHEDEPSHEHVEHEHSHEGHNHGQASSWSMLAILAFPLILGVLVPAKPLGANAISTSGVTTSLNGSRASSVKMSVVPVAPTDRNILDWVRTLSGSSDINEISNQPADVTGFVYRDIRFKDTPQNFMLARFVLSCCVADASAIGITIASPKASSLAQDSWIHVKGKFQVQDFNGQKTAVLIPDSVESITQPDHPYLYP